jgi:glucuronosyltransferase
MQYSFPQCFLLIWTGHPKIRLFISHGGLLSTQQTIYHGVPALFFPVFFDQVTNTKYALKNGFALSLDLHNFTEQEFETALNRLLTESKYESENK